MKPKLLLLLAFLVGVTGAYPQTVTIKKASDLTPVTTATSDRLLVLADPAGTAEPTQITVGNFRLASVPNVLTTAGDMLLYNGTAYVRVGAGTSGQVWTANGAGQMPTWQASSGGSSGVTSLASLTGVITLSSDFGTSGQQIILTHPYVAANLPSDFATASANNPAAGSFTQANFNYLGSGTTCYGHINGDDGLTLISDIGSMMLASPNFYLQDIYHSISVMGGASSGGGFLLENAANGSGLFVQLNKMASAPSSQSAGGILYDDPNGSLHAMDTTGNDGIISPHATDAPPALYEAGPGVDEMHRAVNVFLGTITWHNETRMHHLLELQVTANLDPANSAAAWNEVQNVRLPTGKMVCTVVETFADYQTRTGTNLWPGYYPTSDADAAAFAVLPPDQKSAQNATAQAAFAALIPSTRWNFVEANSVLRSQDKITQWQTAQAAALAAGKPFTRPQPALYVARPSPFAP